MAARPSPTALSPASAIRGLMARPVLTGILGALAIATSAILVRFADVSPSTAAFFRCAYALPALGLLALVEERRYGPRAAGQRRLALVAGLFFAADLVIWHHSIEWVGAGLATVLANTQVVIVGVLAWLLLGERPSSRVLISVPIVLGGIVLISGVIGSGAYGEEPLLGTISGVATAFAYTGFLLVLRQGNRDVRRPAGPLFDATLAAAFGSAAAGLLLGELDLAPSWPSHGWLVLLALTSQVVGWLLISLSLPRLPAAVTSVVLTIQPVGSVLLGVVLLAEAPSVMQLVGVVAIVVGLVTATLRRPDATHPRTRAATAPALFQAGTRLRALTICLLLVLGAFLLGWLMPVPAAGHEAREQIERQVRERLPEWEIANLTESYEGSWVIAVRCGDAQVDFRLLRDARPTGGLPWGDYWILAGDTASYERLQRITEELGGWLIWRGEPAPSERLPCETAATTAG